ncbi:MAG: SPOR domain-containing protein, partial [Fidelibacterota bacterium]
MYLQLLDEGKRDEVASNLPNLEMKYPEHPGVLYLKALMEVEGEKAIKLYQELFQSYPHSEYADDASMKVGEYLYARGLYSQASKQFRSIPMLYPETHHLERSLALMVNSYLATGEEDSARYYLRYFGNKYTKLNITEFGIDMDKYEVPMNLVKVEKEEAKKKIATARNKQKTRKVVIPVDNGKDRPWVVQVGAFSNFNNAKALKLKLGSAGYSVQMEDVMSNGRRL